MKHIPLAESILKAFALKGTNEQELHYIASHTQIDGVGMYLECDGSRLIERAYSNDVTSIESKLDRKV